jgi:hypothetical protein
MLTIRVYSNSDKTFLLFSDKYFELSRPPYSISLTKFHNKDTQKTFENSSHGGDIRIVPSHWICCNLNQVAAAVVAVSEAVVAVSEAVVAVAGAVVHVRLT